MLYIICGEDNVSSRDYFLQLQSEYKEKGNDLKKIAPSDLNEVLMSSADTPNLFGQQQIFLAENLNKVVSRKKGNKPFELLEQISKNKQTILLDWEDGISQRELKISALGKVKEFKPSASIFKLLDACYPSNLQTFIFLLRSVCTTQNEMFVYIMLRRHIRNLLLVSSKAQISTLQSWQVHKLQQQVKFWIPDALISFYERLISLDISLKTGKNAYSLKSSLELLACYYL
jgi:DNA polymerase III delta subunit